MSLSDTSHSPLSVLLVGNYLPDRQQSMQRYAEVLRAELAARGHTVELLRPEPRFAGARAAPTGRGKWLGYVDKFILFPSRLRREIQRRPEALVHICDHSNAMYAAHIGRAPQLTTCHDLLAIRAGRGEIPQAPTGWTGRRLQAWITRGLRQSQRILCVSFETKRQLLALPGLTDKPVDVVHNGLNHPYAPLSSAASAAIFAARPALAPHAARRYVFFVGGDQWYKNRSGMLRMFLRYAEQTPSGDLALVAAGKPWSAVQEAVLAAAPAAVRARVFHVGSPDNDGLNALYARAECLFFPSLEEGYGWPILEAMQVGCRVLTTGRAPMTEIGGETVAYLDPRDEADGAEKLAAVLGESEATRQATRAAAQAQAAGFATATMIDGTLASYRAALAQVRS
jgi:glycosyltransferase involved in cell wall biosynthesis